MSFHTIAFSGYAQVFLRHSVYKLVYFKYVYGNVDQASMRVSGAQMEHFCGAIHRLMEHFCG